MCKYGIFVAKMCKYGIFVAKICKYGIFVTKIYKYALIDSFQGSAGSLDSAASCAALPGSDKNSTTLIISHIHVHSPRISTDAQAVRVHKLNS